jgi:3-phenylpropionate/cinnamic acid dioxygenase small subunit
MLGATDRLALIDLVHRYAAGVDERQFDSVVELFTETAELILPDPPSALEPVHRHSGHPAIRTAMAALAATIRTEHAIVGEVYDAGSQPDNARGRIACVAHHWRQRGDQLTDLVWHLRYRDEYLRTDAGWRFARRTVTINAIETRPVRRVRSDRPSE